MQKDLPDNLLANIELEQSLLGAVLSEPYHLARIKNLRADHFFEAKPQPH
jgi:replicative DNA helicase